MEKVSKRKTGSNKKNNTKKKKYHGKRFPIFYLIPVSQELVLMTLQMYRL